MLIDKLDFVLNENRINSGFGERGQNVLIIGPTGSGKTAQLKQWINNHKDEFVCYTIHANEHPHLSELKLHKGTIRSLLGINEIKNINVKDKILIIDHFDLTDREVRNELLSLVRDRTIRGPYLDGRSVKLDKFWYIIAIAYPESHFGYEQLSDDDINAFDFVFSSIEFTSNAKTEDEYIEDVVNDIFGKLDDEGKKNMLNAQYSHLGIGMAIRNEYLWNRDIPSDKDIDDLSFIIFNSLKGKIKNN